MKKKLIIVSPFRFFLSICLMMGLIVGIASMIFNKVNAETDAFYEEVVICEGDTLWEIASEYTDDKTDIRKVIFDICKFNGIKAGDLVAGDKIFIPVNA